MPNEENVRPSSGTMAALAGAMLLAVVGVAMPIAAFLGATVAGITWTGAAEILEHTGGLEPRTFHLGAIGGLQLDASVLLWCIVRRFSGDRARTRPWAPLLVLVLVYLVCQAGALVLEVGAQRDVPDALHAMATLGFLLLGVVVLPPAALLGFARVVAAAWRAARDSNVAAGRLIGLNMAAGASGLALFALLGAGAQLGYLGDAHEPVAEDRDLSGPPAPSVEGLRLAFESTAATLESSSAHALVTGTRLADAAACAVDVLGLHEDGRSYPKLLSQRVQREYGLPDDVADLLILEKVIDVCATHALRPYPDFGAALGAAVRNAAIDLVRKKSNRFNFGRGDRVDPEFFAAPPDDLERADALAKLQHCRQSLPPSLRQVVDVRIDQDLPGWVEVGKALDLNIRWLRAFAGGATTRLHVVGDHAKDRTRVEAARLAFRDALALPPASDVPCSVDPYLSLPHGFDAIETAVADTSAIARWDRFFEAHVPVDEAPAILGLSLMGPAQVVPALHLARWARRRWPQIMVVAGGTHVTLLASTIAADARYGRGIDGFLAGHCEHALVNVVRAAVADAPLPHVLRAGAGAATPPAEPPWTDWPTPVFDPVDLRLYDPDRLSLPLQLTRGCAYGRCAFCTYPAVEALAGGANAPLARRYLAHPAFADVRRVSLKDSLATVPGMRVFGRAVAQVRPHLTWSATTKVSRALDATTLRELHGLGLRTIELGIESIHPRTQQLIDKVQSVALIEGVVEAAASSGVSVVLNLIYGFPGETEAEAHAQLAWFERMRAGAPSRVHGSHNLVEVNRSAPFALAPARYGIELGPVGPWAFSYVWNAPAWRPAFAPFLAALEA